jgi:Rad3-related DNA helicase
MDYANIPAHQAAERVFRTLLPQKGLTEREGQIALCHQMLDTLIASRTALFDAGVGIGKTYAYLTACILLQRFYSQRQSLFLRPAWRCRRRFSQSAFHFCRSFFWKVNLFLGQ